MAKNNTITIDGSTMASMYSINPVSTTIDTLTGGDATSSLRVNGTSVFKDTAEFERDITISGVSLKDSLDKINQRLNILHPNEDLESRWEQLRALGEQYRALEKELFEKEEIIRILKS